MPSQKLENLLNLALAATTGEKEKSQELAVGFSPETRTWELIVKYHGALKSWNQPLSILNRLSLAMQS